jgi:hypothetical protein
MQQPARRVRVPDALARLPEPRMGRASDALQNAVFNGLV